MESAFAAIENISEEYDVHPEGWRVLFGKDKDGYDTAYILHNDHGWTIKFPKFGMNGLAEKFKIEEDELIQDIIKDPFPFGYRIVSEHMFHILLQQSEKQFKKIMDSSECRPVSDKEIQEYAATGKEAYVVGGPTNITQSPIAPISAAQVKLEQKLKENLEHLTDGMYQ